MSATAKYWLAISYRVVLLGLLCLFARQCFLATLGAGVFVQLVLALVLALVFAGLVTSAFLAVSGVVHQRFMRCSGWGLYNELGFFKTEEMIAIEVISLLIQAVFFYVFIFGLFVSGLVSLALLLPSAFFKLKMMPRFVQSAGKALDPGWPFGWVDRVIKA